MDSGNPVRQDGEAREAFMRRLAGMANAMTEAMSQGGTGVIIVDETMRDDLIAAIGFVSIDRPVPLSGVRAEQFLPLVDKIRGGTRDGWGYGREECAEFIRLALLPAAAPAEPRQKHAFMPWSPINDRCRLCNEPCGAEVHGDTDASAEPSETKSSDGLCPVPPATLAVSTQTACETEGGSSDLSAAARRMSGNESTGSLASAIAASRCENGVSPGPSDSPPPPDAVHSATDACPQCGINRNSPFPCEHPFGCEWPEGAQFGFYDEPGEHDPCYVVMPGGAMIALNHDARPGVDVARAKFIIAACNEALRSPAPAVGVTGATHITDAMLDAHIKATGDWVNPFAAEFDGGCQISCELTQEDADRINEDSRDQLRKGYAAALSASDAVAGEPDKQMLEYARRLNDIAIDVELAQGGLGGSANASDLRRIAQRIVALPHVRDREAIAQIAEWCRAVEKIVALAVSDGEWLGRHDALEPSETIRIRGHAVKVRTDSILALSPVPDATVSGEPREHDYVLAFVSDDSVAIYDMPVIAWQDGDGTWWAGLPQNYIKLEDHGWKVDRWQLLPESSPQDAGRAAAIEECANIALAIDSGRGNEKEIAKAIRSLSTKGGER